VGSELNPVVAEVERIGHRVDHQRLGQARHPDQQAVAPGKYRDQQLFEDRMLTDDDLGHLALQLRERVLQAFDSRDVVLLLQGFWRAGIAHARFSYLDLEPNAHMPEEVARSAPRGSSLNVISEIAVGKTSRSISAPSLGRRTKSGMVTTLTRSEVGIALG